jgi:hypothetical protein
MVRFHRIAEGVSLGAKIGVVRSVDKREYKVRCPDPVSHTGETKRTDMAERKGVRGVSQMFAFCQRIPGNSLGASGPCAKTATNGHSFTGTPQFGTDRTH